MVAMKVGGEKHVDLTETGELGDFENALGVAIFGARIAGIGQQRLSGGAHDEGGSTAFGVDPINGEPAGLRTQKACEDEAEYEDKSLVIGRIISRRKCSKR